MGIATTGDSRAKAADSTGKTCFVIMPCDRVGVPAPIGVGDERQHFDQVYELICEIVERLDIRRLRSDRRAEAVPIHGGMLTDIIDADLAIDAIEIAEKIDI